MRLLVCLFVVVLVGLLGPGPASAQSECEYPCEDCPGQPEDWRILDMGIGLHMTWMEPSGGCTGPFSCVPWDECRPPREEEEKPQEVIEAELDRLFALDRDQVPAWVRAYKEDFRLEVVQGTLQVASRCGPVITWVALEPSQVGPTRALLGQE